MYLIRHDFMKYNVCQLGRKFYLMFSFQVNFFDDHTKIIMSYVKNDYYVTYIDQDRNANTYCMVHLIQDGCKHDIIERMVFAKSMLKNLVDIEGADI